MVVGRPDDVVLTDPLRVRGIARHAARDRGHPPVDDRERRLLPLESSRQCDGEHRGDDPDHRCGSPPRSEERGERTGRAPLEPPVAHGIGDAVADQVHGFQTVPELGGEVRPGGRGWLPIEQDDHALVRVEADVPFPFQRKHLGVLCGAAPRRGRPPSGRAPRRSGWRSGRGGRRAPAAAPRASPRSPPPRPPIPAGPVRGRRRRSPRRRPDRSAGSAAARPARSPRTESARPPARGSRPVRGGGRRSRDRPRIRRPWWRGDPARSTSVPDSFVSTGTRPTRVRAYSRHGRTAPRDPLDRRPRGRAQMALQPLVGAGRSVGQHRRLARRAPPGSSRRRRRSVRCSGPAR